MKQYCRYCANCIYGDAIYCEVKAKVMSEKVAKRMNKCKNFAFVSVDVFCEKNYRPQKETIKHKGQKAEQQSMEI